MKILFVYPDVNIKGEALSFQFGLGQLSSFLKRNGHETFLYYMHREKDVGKLREAVKTISPELICFTATSAQYKYVREALSNSSFSNSFTVCGGPHVSLMPEELEKADGLDAICRGEGEYPTLELTRALRNKRSLVDIPGLWVKDQGKIHKNPSPSFITDLDKLPFPDRGLFDYQSVIDSDFGTALFMFSRGCPYNCTFCSNNALKQIQSGRYVRFRSVQSCMEEVESVLTQYAVSGLYFNDDVFTLNKQFVLNFCNQYKNGFNMPFQINARVENLDKEMCSVLKDAGCYRVNIGIECGNEKFRAKVLGRKMKNEEIIKAFDMAHSAGIRTKSFNIIGFPGETPGIASDTVNLNARIKPDSLVVYIFEPYPGTYLLDVAKEKGYITGNPWEKNFAPRTDTMLDMPDFTREEIKKVYENFGFNVYKHDNIARAIFYKIYYSRYGDLVLKIFSPIKRILRKLVMGV